MVHCITCNVTYAAILPIFILFWMIWYCRIQSTALFNERDVRWCGFRYSIPLSIDYVWKSCIYMDIPTPSCSYCIWNRHCQNHRSIFPNFLLFPWFDTLEWNRLSCSNSKVHDDTVFADRFRCQLTMFGIPVLIWLSRFFHAQIAYVVDNDKFIAAFFRISYCLLDLIR